MNENSTARRSGGGWSQDDIMAVWNKGKAVPGCDPCEYRQDDYGSLIEFSKYGEKIDGGYGWEIDHIVPVVAGGTDQLANLQPLQWQNNRTKGGSLPDSKKDMSQSNPGWL